jgi:hypothetical protein
MKLSHVLLVLILAAAAAAVGVRWYARKLEDDASDRRFFSELESLL